MQQKRQQSVSFFATEGAMTGIISATLVSNTKGSGWGLLPALLLMGVVLPSHKIKSLPLASRILDAARKMPHWTLFLAQTQLKYIFLLLTSKLYNLCLAKKRTWDWTSDFRNWIFMKLVLNISEFCDGLWRQRRQGHRRHDAQRRGAENDAQVRALATDLIRLQRSF